MKRNQYGYRPQTSTIDDVMTIKDYVEEGFRSGEVTVLFNLDVEGAYNSA